MTEKNRAFDAIPFVSLPQNFPTTAAQFLIATYDEYGPIFRSTIQGEDVVFLVGPEANRFVLSQGREYLSMAQGWRIVTRMLGKGLLTMDGEEHDTHRRLMNPAFTMDAIEGYIPAMQSVIAERMDDWPFGEHVDLYDEARQITFDIAARALVGLDSPETIVRLRTLFLELVDFARLDHSKAHYKTRLMQMRQEIYDLLQAKITQFKQEPAGSVIGQMIQTSQASDYQLTDDQLIAHTNILLMAGHETTTSLMAWTLYHLLKYPDYAQMIRDELAGLANPESLQTVEGLNSLKMLDHVLTETERLYPPIGNGPRRATRDFEYHGYQIPEGTRVLYSIVATHHLPEIYDDPTAFNPGRLAPPREEHRQVPYSLVGFGGGPRICIGINFARIEIKLAMIHMLRTLNLHLADSEPPQHFYRGLTGLPMPGIDAIIVERFSWGIIR